jgi:hypothetical protein
MIPKPHYTLINTSIGNDPAIVVVNSALRTFKNREIFPWHLRISIDCKLLGAQRMPTSEELDALNCLEEIISIPLQKKKNAIFLARVTARGQRILLYRVHNPEIANEVLQTVISHPKQVREWDYQMENDSGWELAQPELRLLERDSSLN